jgi:hypothetical protein
LVAGAVGATVVGGTVVVGRGSVVVVGAVVRGTRVVLELGIERGLDDVRASCADRPHPPLAIAIANAVAAKTTRGSRWERIGSVA